MKINVWVLLLVCVLSVMGSFALALKWFTSRSATTISNAPPPEAINPLDDYNRTLDKLKMIEWQGTTYRVGMYKVNPEQMISLIPNFERQEKATLIKEANQCSFITNGSFYTREATPLGWFVSQGEIHREAVENRLIDGFLAKRLDGSYFLALEHEEEVEWGIQAGPVLLWGGEPTPLRIQHDEPNRRMVAGLTKVNELVFLVFTGKSYLTSGPLLADLPSIVYQTNMELGLSLVTAINLDGGAASSFISDEVSITEQHWLGSVFCVKG